MPIIQEVTDGINLVASSIQNIRTIYNALNDSKVYLEMKHPDVKDDVAAMVVEMRKTLQAIAAASSIITHFRFNISDDEIAHEPTRFNDYLIDHKMQARDVEGQLDSLRGHCGKIRDHAERLELKAQRARLPDMFALLGLNSREREEELSNALQEVYNEELAIHVSGWNLHRILNQALDEINAALGPPGVMDAANVAAAAALLGEYAEPFNKLESQANFAALQLQHLIDELMRR